MNFEFNILKVKKYVKKKFWNDFLFSEFFKLTRDTINYNSSYNQIDLRRHTPPKDKND